MPAPTPLAVRQAMWHRYQQGATTAELSLAFDLPARTVRGLLQRWREQGEKSLAPDRVPRSSPVPPPDHPAYEPAIQLRQDHPGWGAGLIRVYLAMQQVQPLPAERTLQRWFRRAGLAPAPPGRWPTVPRRRATSPHEIWEMDAAEQIPLGNGTKVSWLRINDEFSGAVLWTAVFPPREMERRPSSGDSGTIAACVLPMGTAPGHPG